MQNQGMMIYGYARVSTAAQVLANQLAQLKTAGCEKVFREKITGTTADRPQLQKLMSVLAPGDVVITPAVDRLSRDTTDLMVIARDMQRVGAGLRSLAEPVLDTTGVLRNLCLPCLVWPRNWNVVASPSAPHGAVPTQWPRA
jgi:DNA invertase Pin-like site-specific DNA recombinase